MLTIVMTTTGYLFWAAIGVIILLDVLALSTEDDGFGAWAVFLTAAGFIFTVAFTDAFIGVNWAWVIVAFAAYLLLGVAWSFKKWVDFVKNTKKELLLRYKPEELRDGNKMPMAANNKQRITTWMATWPLSFTWWVLTYPRHFFIWAYDRLSTVFDRISTKIWES